MSSEFWRSWVRAGKDAFLVDGLTEDSRNFKWYHNSPFWLDQLYEVVGNDDEEAFVELLKKDALDKPQVFAPEFVSMIIAFNSVLCAAALLKHKYDDFVCLDIDEPDPRSKLPPLHSAAGSGHFELVKLFLRHNARPDSRIDSRGGLPELHCHEYHNMRAIDYTILCIRQDRCWNSWTPNESVLKMIITLCLPEHRRHLEVCRTLLDFTKEKVEEDMLRYAEQGKLIELAVLLLASQGSCKTVRNCITAELTLQTVQKVLPANGTETCVLATLSKGKQRFFMNALVLLEIFERAGNPIKRYIQHMEQLPEEQVVQDVVCILQNAGFIVRDEDTELSHVNRYLFLETPKRDGNSRKIGLQNSSSKLFTRWIRNAYPANDFLMGRHTAESTKHSVDNLFLLPNLAPIPADSRSYSYISYTINDDDWKSKLVYTINDDDWKSKLVYTINDDDWKSKLDEALQPVRDHHYLKYWSYNKSIFKLLYILCLPELRQFLHGFQLVEPDMEEFRLIIHQHAMEGHLVELATLLMVYREKLMPLIACQSDGGLRWGYSIIHQCIMREVQEQIDGEIRHMGRNPSGVLKCKEKATKLIAAFQLLEVFRHAGDVIHDFLQSSGYSSTTKIGVASHVALLLKEKGFSLRKRDISLDDLKPFSINVEREQSEHLADTYVTNTSKAPVAFHVEEKAHTCMELGRMRVGTTPSSFSCKDRGFHAFQMAPATLVLKSPMPVRTGASRSSEKVKPWISNLSSSRKWACIASTMGGAKGVACYTPFTSLLL